MHKHYDIGPGAQNAIGEFSSELVDTVTGKKTQIHKSLFNLIVNDYSIIVAAVLKGHAGYSGITYWAVGEGEWTGTAQTSTWDTLSADDLAAKSQATLTQLYSEKARTTVSMDFIDTSNNIVAGPTNRLEIRASFDTSVSGYFREFGLYGGNATSTLNSGLLVDHLTHRITTINIPSPTTVWNVTLRLTV